MTAAVAATLWSGVLAAPLAEAGQPSPSTPPPSPIVDQAGSGVADLFQKVLESAGGDVQKALESAQSMGGAVSDLTRNMIELLAQRAKAAMGSAPSP
jgi:hypothetical protein